ncbi:Lrp/AsnC family transcriptional regulator [Pedobacter sp.]|uniref:Lrp/AsnC family transcriptional regulator n=1 Tax=Pedobacter sp. TaxID=1411316 RepID=UPI003C336103
MNDYQLDRIDAELLNLLQQNGEYTYKELAVKIGRSKTNIVDWIKILKAEGYIDKYVALVNMQKIKSIFVAFPLIQLKAHTKVDIEGFKKDMDLFEEVMECYHITGNFDFMLKLLPQI